MSTNWLSAGQIFVELFAQHCVCLAQKRNIMCLLTLQVGCGVEGRDKQLSNQIRLCCSFRDGNPSSLENQRSEDLRSQRSPGEGGGKWDFKWQLMMLSPVHCRPNQTSFICKDVAQHQEFWCLQGPLTLDCSTWSQICVF